MNALEKDIADIKGILLADKEVRIVRQIEADKDRTLFLQQISENKKAIAKNYEQFDKRVNLIENQLIKVSGMFSVLKLIGTLIVLILTLKFGDIPDVFRGFFTGHVG